MSGHARLVALIVLGCLGLASLLIGTRSPAFADEKDSLRAQVDQAEQRWNSQGITSYRIVVRRVNSIWHAQTNTIVVVDGQVTEQSSTCVTAPMEMSACQVRPIEPAAYTVPGLFATARALIDQQPADALKLHFDDVYGFPTSMLSDRPEVFDDDEGWAVESFSAL